MSRLRHSRDSRRRLVIRDDTNLKLDPITIDTPDGQTWDGLALIPKGGDPQRRRVAVIVVHGSVGNYITGVPRRVAHGLALAGFTVLSVNTRMANYGVFFGGGLFHRTPIDMDSWVDLAKRMGHTEVVLVGFSMGASIVTYYQATRHRPEVVAVGALAHPASLPDSLKRRWERFGSQPDYETVVRDAWLMIGGISENDALDDEIFVVRRATGPTDEPAHAEIWTYRTWWFSRGPQAHAAMSRRHIGRLGVPLAMIQGADDLIVPPSDGEELARLAHEGGVPDVFHSVVPGANHVFDGRLGEAVERLVDWMVRVVMPSIEERRRAAKSAPTSAVSERRDPDQERSTAG